MVYGPERAQDCAFHRDTVRANDAGSIAEVSDIRRSPDHTAGTGSSLRFQGIFKYAPPGSPIELTGGVERDALIFRVTDHGNGIPASERDRVFTPFYRSPKASGQQSSGLGLSIARRLAEAQAADDLLGAVVQQMSGRPDHERLKVSLEDPAALSFGRFDFVHSLRILGNLVDNAFKYAPPGSPIELTGGVERDALIFRVTDHGNGIPASERDRVFTPFYRSPKASGQQSSGLGLSIARRLAEAQGRSPGWSAYV
ncbi:MAG: hypothetical protein DMD30_15280 [Gemmatimonadetes bacterium]|nr:MAG: hypothetical protein DMD30_15280 [Gemmatimonadota bacterium]